MPSGTYGVEDWGAVSAYGGQANGARAVVGPRVRRTDDWERDRRPRCAAAATGAGTNEALRATAEAR
ncbi:MAG: hypothetical protein V9G12_17700 [Microthrixaceae bacterium]